MIKSFNITSPWRVQYTDVMDMAIALSAARPTYAQMLVQNSLVRSFINNGVWVLSDAIYIFYTNGDSTYALINWRYPFQTGWGVPTLVGSPSFASNTGFETNGTTSYINTDFAPDDGIVMTGINNASFYFDAIPVTGSVNEYRNGGRPNLGSINPSNEVNPHTDTRIYSGIRGITVTGTTLTKNGTSSILSNNHNGGDQDIWKDGVYIETLLNTYNGESNAQPIYIGANNAGGTAQPYGRATKHRVAIFGGDMNSIALNQDTAVKTYLSAA